MKDWGTHMLKSSRVANLIAEVHDEGAGRCLTPGCGRLTMAAAGVGLTVFHCKVCVQRQARHGSMADGPLSAKSVNPHVKHAATWIDLHKADAGVAYALLMLARLLDGDDGGDKRKSVIKSKAIFATLKAAGVSPERMLSICLGVRACLRATSTDVTYLETQVGKVLNRQCRATQGKSFGRSSGRAIRVVGQRVLSACATVADLSNA